MSLNQVQIMGNLTRDPEVKYLPTGTAVSEFGLAINDIWMGQDGQRNERTTFIDVTCWNKTAEFAEKHLKKGAPILVCGRITQDTWEDAQTGQKRSKFKVTAERLVPTFPTWKDDGERHETGTTRKLEPKAAQGRAMPTARPTAPMRGRPAPDPDLDLDPLPGADIDF